MKLLKQNRASSVLGISLDANRLEAAVVRRGGGDAVNVRQSVSAALALSPLTGDPELVGREIKNHLDTAGIGERRCAVCLPLSWVLMLQAKIPEMPEADVASFLQIEAERGFPSGYESLFITNSRFKAPNGDNYATLLAVPRNHLDLLERALRAAKLKPVIFALGVSALQSPALQSNQRVLTLALGSHGLDLQVTGGGGVIALRSLDSAIEMEGPRRHVSADLVAREVRITLGQLPGGFSEGPGPVKIFGEGEAARQFVTEVSPRLAALGLKVELVDRTTTTAFANTPAADIASSSALALAAAYVRNSDFGANLLPPKVSQWKLFVTNKLGTQKLAYAGAAAGFVVLCVGGLFGWQQYRIMRLNSEWSGMSAQVLALHDAHDNTQKYSGWYDPSFRALTILYNLHKSFSTDGSVNAKRVEIHDMNTVTCDGIARSLEAFNSVRDNLSKLPEIGDSLHGETRGTAPNISFNLAFQWTPQTGAPNGN